jgi:hypothetical protein
MKVDPLAFSGLDTVKAIALSNNRIQSLAPNTFINNRQLHRHALFRGLQAGNDVVDSILNSYFTA